jgi:hypothetical protein
MKSSTTKFWIVREYYCKECDVAFEVCHTNLTNRNKICGYCGKKIKETGKVREECGDLIFVKKNGVEIERYKKCNL